jgi:alpha-tubulin suppressor-like RCC1 family protein
MDRNAPQRVGNANDWASIACGYRHTVAIKKDGSIWAWGDNAYGQLGDGTQEYRNVPVQVGEGAVWTAVSTGRHHTLAIKDDGSLWACGGNWYGQLGDGTEDAWRTFFVQVGTDTHWAGVSGGGYHTLAIKDDGSLWTWGLNENGQLGVGGSDILRNSPVRVGDGYRVPAK